MDPSTETEVRELLARLTALPPDTIRAEQQLLDDLGLDGDDAVQLFEAFESQFGGDLAPLYQHWSLHFGPEGCSLEDAGRFVLVGGPLVIATTLITVWANLPEWVAIGAGFAVIVLWIGPLRGWPWKTKTMVPVTVADLVEAASTQRWPILYEQG